MEINNKDIWRDSKNYCIICEKDYCQSGIQIMNNFICEKCVQEMTMISSDNERYDYIKNKIKKAIVSEISKGKE